MEILGSQFSDNQNKAKKQVTEQSSVNFRAVLAANLEQASPHAAIKAANEMHKSQLLEKKKKKQLDVDGVVKAEDEDNPSVMKTIKELKKRLRDIRDAERNWLGL